MPKPVNEIVRQTKRGYEVRRKREYEEAVSKSKEQAKQYAIYRHQNYAKYLEEAEKAIAQSADGGNTRTYISVGDGYRGNNQDTYNKQTLANELAETFKEEGYGAYVREEKDWHADDNIHYESVKLILSWPKPSLL